MQLNPSVIRSELDPKMKRRGWSAWLVGAFAINSMCWIVFLAFVPVDHAYLRAKDAESREGRIVINSAAPYVVAGRPVESHGSQSALATAYQLISLPGLAAGVLIDSLATEFRLNRVLDSQRGAWLFSAEGRSWVLASSLFSGTTVWWLTIGLVVGLLRRGYIKAVQRESLEAG